LEGNSKPGEISHVVNAWNITIKGSVAKKLWKGFTEISNEQKSKYSREMYGCVAKNLALLQNQRKHSQLGKLTTLITDKMVQKSKNYRIKLQKYYFCNGTVYPNTKHFLFYISL